MKAQSEFGGLFDSLADAITFGVAPSLIVLKSLSIPPGTYFSFFLTAAAMVYTLCGVLRLVRFNITNRFIPASLVKTVDTEKNKNFTGLPIPAAAAAVISGNLFLVSNELQNLFPLSEITREWILFLCSLLLGIL